MEGKREEGKGEAGRKEENSFNIKFGELFMLIPYFLCSPHDSDPLLLTSVVNIKQRTVNSSTQPGQTKVNPIFWLAEFPIFKVFYYL